jgi:hypothetical protein
MMRVHVPRGISRPPTRSEASTQPHMQRRRPLTSADWWRFAIGRVPSFATEKGRDGTVMSLGDHYNRLTQWEQRADQRIARLNHYLGTTQPSHALYDGLRHARASLGRLAQKRRVPPSRF